MEAFGTILELSKIEVFDYNEKTRIHEITVGFVETYATSLDKAFLQGLYERYENTPVAKVFILNIQEFERFLIEMLPLWKEREEPVEQVYPKYAKGESVIYQNGDRFELGIVKSVCGDDFYFVNYHMGETAARTHARNLHKIGNAYAFAIERKTV